MLMKCPEKETREQLSIISYSPSVKFCPESVNLELWDCTCMNAEPVPMSSHKSSGEGDTKRKEEVHANLFLRIDFGIGV